MRLQKEGLSSFALELFTRLPNNKFQILLPRNTVKPMMSDIFHKLVPSMPAHMNHISFGTEEGLSLGDRSASRCCGLGLNLFITFYYKS